MTHSLWWLYWTAAFLIVIAILMAIVGIEEWWKWRKGS
jgi:hypothetical protein